MFASWPLAHPLGSAAHGSPAARAKTGRTAQVFVNTSGAHAERAQLSGSHRSTHIASNLASRALASQAKPQPAKRRHFASLDLKRHPDFSHRRPTSQDFRRISSWHFPVISDQANGFSHRWRQESFSIASDFGVCDSNRIAHRGCIARFGPLRFTDKQQDMATNF